MGPFLGQHLAEQMTEKELTQHRLPTRFAKLYHRLAHIELAIEPWKGRYGSDALGAKTTLLTIILSSHQGCCRRSTGQCEKQCSPRRSASLTMPPRASASTMEV